MRIGRIAHAGWVVSFGTTQCLIDPVLKNDFSGGATVLDPPIRFKSKHFRTQSWSGVILSHAHPDHFSLETLNLLDRRTPVYIPSGDFVMERCLKGLGFEAVFPVFPRAKFSIGDVHFRATPSEVPFAEMGVLIQAGGLSCWNMADTIVSTETMSWVRRAVGRVDLLLFPFQPLIESLSGIDVVGSDFPVVAYQKLLKTASRIDARYLVPSACGFRSSIKWVNSRMFPTTETKFAADLLKNHRTTQVFILKPGDEIRLQEKRAVLKSNGVRFISAGKVHGTKWDPSREVGALVDPNFPGYPIRYLISEVGKYLEGDFLLRLKSPEFKKWLADLHRNRVVWQLEVRFPRGSHKNLFLDFGQSRLSWNVGIAEGAQVRTQCAASAILGVVLGDLDQAAVMHAGLIRRKGRQDFVDRDPLTAVIYRMAAERFLMKRLSRTLGKSARFKT